MVKPIASSSSSDVFFESSFNSNVKDTALSTTKVVTLASKNFLLSAHQTQYDLEQSGPGGI